MLSALPHIVTELPEPILFHPLKHHLQYIKAYIRNQYLAPEAIIKASLLTIGSSQLDFYTGQLTAHQIAREVMDSLQKQDLLQPENFKHYLTSTNLDFRTIKLSDNSNWILRWGDIKGRHVHIHPARYAANTIRVKANTLKTAIAVLLAPKQYGKPEIDLQLVNQVRIEWLKLSPVKAFNAEEGLSNLIKLLASQVVF